METTDVHRVVIVLRLIAALGLFVAMAYTADWLLRAENFPVNSVRFEGPFQHVTQQQLERATLDALRGNFFLVDLGVVKRKVESLPWVYSASVRRRFPRDISIVFREQRLAARWGDDAWVNAHGQVVRVTADDLADHLPKLSGPDGTSAFVYRSYHGFLVRLAPIDLRLVGLSLSARRSWRLELMAPQIGQSFGMVLDHEQPYQRVERFVRAYNRSIAPQVARIRQVDLRYTNGFAVQWNSEGTPPRVAHSTATHDEG